MDQQNAVNLHLAFWFHSIVGVPNVAAEALFLTALVEYYILNDKTVHLRIL